MGDDEIQKMLDGFDMQLASGQIDLATYQALTSRWEAKMSGSASTAAAPSRPAAIVIQCPKCGGPPDETLVPGRPYKCPWDSTVYTQEVAQAQMERPRRDLQKRLEQYASGLGSGGVVDATARAFIFREKLCPDLELEFNRSVENLDGYREYPLFQLPSASRLPECSAEESPLRVGGSLQPIRDLTAKLNAPVVREFVVAPADEQRLAAMQMRASELIYTANASEQSSRFTSEGYRSAAKNVAALRELYEEAVKTEADEPTRQFLLASMERLRGTETVLDVLAVVYGESPPSWRAGPSANKLEGALRFYEEALRIADDSRYTPNETAPWRQGVEREMSAIGLECALLNCYDRASSIGDVGFGEFLEHLRRFLDGAKPALDSLGAVETVVDSLISCAEAKRQGRPFARLMDWSWLNREIDSNQRKIFGGLFGASEEVETVEQYWQPFWLAAITYSQAVGAVFRTGSMKQALALLDATSTGTVASVVEEEAPMHGVLVATSTAAVLDHRLSLPAVTGRPAALKQLEALVRSKGAYPNARVTLRKLIYLPVARVTFRSKQSSRVVVLSAVSPVNTQVDNLRLATAEFVRHYSAL